MARAVWTGSLSFGLVNVPVAMFTATEEKTVRFNQFHAGTSDRVRNKRVNERTGEEVAYQDVVKGYDIGGGEYVILTPDEIAAVAPGRSRTIEVSSFVDLTEIDSVYFDRPYYLAPPSKDGGKGGERAYALLREAMLRANKAALATFVLRDKQHLAAIRPRSDVLVLETLHYHDEVRDPVAEIDTLPVDAEVEPRELEMANVLLDSMTTSWQPAEHRDDYRRRLEDLIDQKRSGSVATTTPQPAEGAPVVDLLQALEASVRASRGTGPDDLGALGKAELQRRAAALHVAGRSKMRRDELEAAVRKASAGTEPAARRREAS